MNLTPEMILRGYQANTAALEEMIFVKGKVAIVTGGTSGLGFCVARRLCQGGAKVVLASSTREKGDLAVRLLKEEGFDVIFCKTDVRSEEESDWSSLRWRPMVRIDILVTAAGILELCAHRRSGGGRVQKHAGCESAGCIPLREACFSLYDRP